MTEVQWKRELEQSVRDLHTLGVLLDRPELSADPAAESVAREYPVLVPRPFLAKIDKTDPDDPLLAQVCPSIREMEEVPGFTRDPLEEAGAAKTNRCLNKYHGRTLILASDACAVHCRFCFRKHFPKENPGPSPQETIRPDQDGETASEETTPFSAISPMDRVCRQLQHVRCDPGIDEVILSGGDPLTLDNFALNLYVEEIFRISHVKRLRIHTRFPVMIPSRIDSDLSEILRASKRCASYMVVHVNHPGELDDAFREKIGTLIDRGVPIMSQTVLLKKVNDCPGVLRKLFADLVDMRVLPYYLHLLDKISGTSHFEVGQEEARVLMETMVRSLPGYAVPRLVREVPGEKSKSFLF